MTQIIGRKINLINTVGQQLYLLILNNLPQSLMSRYVVLMQDRITNVMWRCLIFSTKSCSFNSRAMLQKNNFPHDVSYSYDNEITTDYKSGLILILNLFSYKSKYFAIFIHSKVNNPIL